MRNLRYKDLVSIFLILSALIILTYYPLKFNKSYLEFISFALLLLFSGYSLISFLNPKQNYRDILKFPFLILAASALLNIIVAIGLKFTKVGLHLRSLTLVLSIITMFLTLAAFIHRINTNYALKHEKPDIKKDQIENKEIESSKTKSTAAKESKILKSNAQKFADFIIRIDLLVIFVVIIVSILSFVISKLDLFRIHLILGLLFMLFIPGYVISVILFPDRNLGKIEVLALGFGISLPLASIVGIILVYANYSISVSSILFTLTLLTLILTLIAFVRRVKTQ